MHIFHKFLYFFFLSIKKNKYETKDCYQNVVLIIFIKKEKTKTRSYINKNIIFPW